ncbi:hypothetical protein C8J56DRAFT_1055231 [Mycena floridula]|nr:hypothetical protein C8J56DRAFT_1055231 [Mycena floridula]
MADTPGIPSSVLKQIFAQIRNTRTSRSCELALDVLYCYDFVTTLDQEVDLIWVDIGSSSKSGKHLPHWPSFKVYLNQKCQGAVLKISFAAILVLRIWAIYNRNNMLLAVLGAFGVLQIAASATIMGISITQGIPSSEPGPGFFVCTITTPPYFAAYWIPILVFEFALFILTLIKGIQNLRQTSVSVLSGTSGQALLNILVRDSVIYFFIIAAVYAGNASVWYWADSSLYEASSVFGIIIPPIVANKLLFSLRHTFYHGTTQNSSDFEMTSFRVAGRTPSSSGQNTAQESEGNRWGEWGGKQERSTAAVSVN